MSRLASSLTMPSLWSTPSSCPVCPRCSPDRILIASFLAGGSRVSSAPACAARVAHGTRCYGARSADPAEPKPHEAPFNTHTRRSLPPRSGSGTCLGGELGPAVQRVGPGVLGKRGAPARPLDTATRAALSRAHPSRL